MGLIPDLHRNRILLVQVGLADNVSAAATQLDGPMRGTTWTVISATPLAEFLSRPNHDVPDGTPLIRLDLTGDDFYFAHLARGPYWDADLRPGYVRPRLGEPRRYDGEPWTAMPGWYLAPNVYAALAPNAGVVVENAADHLARA